MNTFLREARKLITSKITERCCLIIGNESCDLDSAISSISLAYYFNRNKTAIPNTSNISHVIPIFNIRRDELPLKTEVVHFLKCNAIESDNITCKDDLTDAFTTENPIILVDHHLSKYSPVAVFDHRPFDASSTLPKECNLVLEQIGSCATLIAEVLLKDPQPCEYKDVLRLLYATIVLDTVNFSKEAERAKEKDFEIAAKIETLLKITNVEAYRKEVFDDLVQARADISTLNSYQILLKDMKLIASKTNETIKVALPGFPILVKDYVKLADAEKSIEKFSEQHRCQLIVLIGMKVTDGNLERDVGVIDMGNSKLFGVIVENLLNYSEKSLDLLEYSDLEFSTGRYFEQRNLRASRKQILPLVKSVLDSL